MTARLIRPTGRTARKDYVVNDAARLGSSPESDIRIVAQGVSRRHARIWSELEQFFIEDVGATNGTFLNGGRIQREALHHLDVITLGREVDLIFLRKDDEPDVAIDRIQHARVFIVDGPEAGKIVDVPKGELTFGRAQSCNVVLASALVSKVHARLQRTANQLVLEDLQSSNGTFVNSKRVDSIGLKDGDVISFAGVRSVSVTLVGDVDPSTQTDVTGIITGPAFDQEWKTRIDWAPEDLAVIEAARAEAVARAALRAPAVVKAAALPTLNAAAPAGSTTPGASVSEKPEPGAATKAAPPAARARPASSTAAPSAPSPATTVPPAGAKPVAPTPKAAERIADQPATSAPVTARAQTAPPPPSTTPASAPAPAASSPRQRTAPLPPADVPVQTSIMPATVIGARSDAVKAAPSIRGLRLVGPGGPFTLGLGTFTVGRAPASNVRLDDPMASRFHARITVTNASVTIEDLQPLNGTLVNGQAVMADYSLRHGDTVNFGSLDLQFIVELITV